MMTEQAFPQIFIPKGPSRPASSPNFVPLCLCGYFSLLSARPPPRLDEILECPPQLRILQLRQIHEMPRRARHRPQLRPLASAQRPLHEADVAHRVVIERLAQTIEDLHL